MQKYEKKKKTPRFCLHSVCFHTQTVSSSVKCNTSVSSLLLDGCGSTTNIAASYRQRQIEQQTLLSLFYGYLCAFFLFIYLLIFPLIYVFLLLIFHFCWNFIDVVPSDLSQPSFFRHIAAIVVPVIVVIIIENKMWVFVFDSSQNAMLLCLSYVYCLRIFFLHSMVCCQLIKMDFGLCVLT